MAFKPTQDRVLVKIDPAAEITPGGIILPTQAQEKTSTGEILEVGPGYELPGGGTRPLQVKPGERVAFPEFAGVRMKHEGIDVVLLFENEILGVLE